MNCNVNTERDLGHLNKSIRFVVSQDAEGRQKMSIIREGSGEILVGCLSIDDSGSPYVELTTTGSMPILLKHVNYFGTGSPSCVKKEAGIGYQCDVCKRGLERHSPGAYDEDDRFWCSACMKNWEDGTGQDWATGKPF